MRIFYITFLFAAILCSCNSKEQQQNIQKSEKDSIVSVLPELQAGDIIFQISKSSQSKAIQLATHSKYSHVGVIFKEKEELFVFEAVQPVKLTPLTQWINRGKDRHYVVKRLKEADKYLSEKGLQDMKLVGSRFMGKDYDIYFGWSDDKIYCSELVWKIYQEALGLELGDLETLSSFDLSSDAVQQKMRERYGNDIPKNEKVISPVAIFDSDKLVMVKEE